MKVLIVFTTLSLIGQSYQWTYDDEPLWPGICTSGGQQSPINIMSRDALYDPHQAHIRGPLKMTGYEKVQVNSLNDGHTVKWSVSESSPAPQLSGGPLRGDYSLIQFHLHWLSEHAVDGIKYPLEIHFVHAITGLTLEQALNRSDGLAVIGVFSEVRSDPGSEYSLLEIMPSLRNITNKKTSDSKTYTIDITRLMSPEPDSYFTYHGSLTTPNCEESVTWIVMDRTTTISDGQYKQLSKVDVGGISNYRSLHPVNRVIYRSVASCSAALAPGFFISIVTFLSCVSARSLCEFLNFKRRLIGAPEKDCRK